MALPNLAKFNHLVLMDRVVKLSEELHATLEQVEIEACACRAGRTI